MANASKRTEEEMLQDTFQNFKTQTDTEEPPTESSGGDGGNGGGKKSGGKGLSPLVIVGGVAALGLIGYVVFKPMLFDQPQQQVQQQQNPQVAQNNTPVVPNPLPVPVPAPVPEVAPVQPVAPTVDPLAQLNQAAVNPNPVPAPVVPPLESFHQEATATPMPVMPVAPTPAPVEQVAVNPVYKPEPAPVVPAQVAPNPTQAVATPVAPVEAPVNHAVAQVVNAPSDAAVADLVNRFEGQTSELKNLLGGLDGRMGVVENKLNQQDGINQKVDARLNALEEGKVDKKGYKFGGNGGNSSAATTDKACDCEGGKSTKTNTEAAPKKSAPVKKAVNNTPRVAKKTIVDDGNILVDKNGGKRVKPEDLVKKEVQKEVLAPMKIHSIYGKRVWTSNSNGTLSTFTEGDRLPTGEVIKEINDDSFTIVTNKRKIVKE